MANDILDPRTFGQSVSPYPPELQGEAASLHRRRALADMLMLRAMQPMPQPTGYGGIPVPISPFAGLSHIAQMGLGVGAGSGVDAGEQALAQRYSSGLQDATSQMQDAIQREDFKGAGDIASRWPALKAVSEKLFERQIPPRPTFHPYESADPTTGKPTTSWYDPNNPPAGAIPKPAPLHAVPLGGTTNLESMYGPPRVLPHTLDPNRVPLPEDMPAIIKAIGEYHQPGYTGVSARSPGAAHIMAAVFKAYPNYDASVFPVVQAGEKEFNQKNAPQVRAFGTFVGHVQAAKELYAALENPTDITRINQARNFFQEEFGYPAPAALDTARPFLAGEAVKAVTGGPGAVEDRKIIAERFSKAQSPAAFNAAAETAIKFGAEQLKGHLQQLKGMTKGKRAEEDFIQYLTPAARRAFFAAGGVERRQGTQEGVASPQGVGPSGGGGQVIRFDAQGNMVQ